MTSALAVNPLGKTLFFEEFDKLREKDPRSHTGWESDRTFGKRFGITNKTITNYRYGCVPRAATLRRMAKSGHISEEVYHRLLQAAAGEIPAPAESTKKVPVYSVSGVTIEGIRGVPLFEFDIPKELNKEVSRDSLVGIHLPIEATNVEPKIPGGAIIFYSNRPCEPKDGKIYAFGNDRKVILRQVRTLGRKMWVSGKSLAKEDLRSVSKEWFNNSVLGEVVLSISVYFDSSVGEIFKDKQE